MALWKVAQGFALSEVVTVKDGAGAVITTYTGTEPLSGNLWGGDQLSPLATFTPTWLTPALGTLTVTLTSVETASVTPGTFTLDVFLADRSGHLYRGQVEILPAAGAAAALWSYITYAQLLTYAPQAGRLLDSVTDESQFAKQRHQASLDLDRLILNRYHPQPGRSRRYLSADGTAAGPYLNFAPGPGGAAAPSRATIAGYLGTAALVVNADLVEAVAYLTLEILYQGQPGRDNPYAETGRAFLKMGLDAFRRALVEVDINNDAIAELRLDQDVTFLT